MFRRIREKSVATTAVNASANAKETGLHQAASAPNPLVDGEEEGSDERQCEPPHQVADDAEDDGDAHWPLLPAVSSGRREELPDALLVLPRAEHEQPVSAFARSPCRAG